MAVVMDNASNNDMMMQSLEDKLSSEGIQFSATFSRLHYMPHTIHLAALKVNISS
jgi:hypothetical protein